MNSGVECDPVGETCRGDKLGVAVEKRAGRHVAEAEQAGWQMRVDLRHKETQCLQS